MNWFNDIISNYNEQMKDGKEISDDALFVFLSFNQMVIHNIIMFFMLGILI